ncbi:hypothetical protein OsJ_22164 [Oryza sativa Japonica Group]|uniref:Uncharacterized protein n=1 Tax=Oryza sativa subsp. japonica TaxID=39947 RepID=B9FQ81_ORYSJ|nr:hypothetical protein OsJ_22164 [Oryza sativa Japonica Group]
MKHASFAITMSQHSTTVLSQRELRCVLPHGHLHLLLDELLLRAFQREFQLFDPLLVPLMEELVQPPLKLDGIDTIVFSFIVVVFVLHYFIFSPNIIIEFFPAFSDLIRLLCIMFFRQEQLNI